jgi:hypothetical protein
VLLRIEDFGIDTAVDAGSLQQKAVRKNPNSHSCLRGPTQVPREDMEEAFPRLNGVEKWSPRSRWRFEMSLAFDRYGLLT